LHQCQQCHRCGSFCEKLILSKELILH
jgi:hypothetical protein